MLKISDKVRAAYLLRARRDGKFRLWPFVQLNKWRYLFLALYMGFGVAYFRANPQLALAKWFFAGLCIGWIITDLSWLRGRNKRRDFAFKTKNWDEVSRLAQGD
jgi:hypothetical protein